MAEARKDDDVVELVPFTVLLLARAAGVAVGTLILVASLLFGQRPTTQALEIGVLGGAGGGAALAFLTWRSLRRRLQPGWPRPAPEGAPTPSPRRLLIASLAVGTSLGVLLLVAADSSQHAADARLTEAALFLALSVATLLLPVWLAGYEGRCGRTFWVEMPRLKGKYDPRACYYTPADGAEVEQDEVLRPPMRLVRQSVLAARSSRWFWLWATLGTCVGLLDTVLRGKSLRVFAANWLQGAALLALLATALVGMAILVRRRIARHGPAREIPPAPPDAEFVIPRLWESPYGWFAIGVGVVVPLIPTTPTDAGLGGVAGVVVGLALLLQATAVTLRRTELRAGGYLWTPMGKGGDIETSGRGYKRGVSRYRTDQDPTERH